MRIRYYILNGTVLHETTAAVLLKLDGNEHWLPKSKLSEDSRHVIDNAVRDDEVEIEVEDRFAKERGLA